MLVVPSVLDAVTVHADGALCTRVATVPAENGRLPAQVRVNGLPLGLNAGSLRASVLQGPSGLAVRDIRPLFDAQLPPEPDIPLEQRALEEAQETLAHVTSELQRVQKELEALQRLGPAFLKPKAGEEPREAAPTAVLTLARFVDEELAALHSQRLDLERRQRDATAEVELRQRRLAEGSSSVRGQRAMLYRAALITLSEAGPAEGETRLALEYAVRGARWVPGYELRMPRSLDSGTLRMRASVLQRTGEDWTSVRLSLSTAELHRRADVPELKALRIGRSQPAPLRSGWREPPPGLDELFSGYDAAASAVRRPPPPPPPPQRRKEQQARQRSITTEIPQLEPGPQAPAAAAMPMEGSLAEGPFSPEEAEEFMPRTEAPTMPPRKSAGFLSLGGLSLPSPSPARAAPPMARASRAGGGGPERAKKRAPPGGGFTPDADEESSGAFAFGGAPGAPEPHAPAGIEPAGHLLDYDGLELAPADQPGLRGRLQPRPLSSSQALVALTAVHMQVDIISLVAVRQQLMDTVHHIAPPTWAVPPRKSTPHFDYRYDVETRMEVPSDGAWHTVSVFSAPVGLTAEFLCVPSLEPQVFRTVKVENRTPHALLAGPVDVTLGDEFLMTSPLPTLAPGATQRLGLGVEESIKVSRNTRFDEASGGVFGGATVLTHRVSVEVANRLGRPVTVEVRERVPVAPNGEKDIKVEETEIQPPWHAPTPLPGETPVEGERAWRVTVQAGEKQALDATWAVRIPSSKMLQGGNRRT